MSDNCIVCRVSCGVDGWTAKVPTGDLGPFMSRDLALRLAISEAMAIRRTGGAARVSVDAADGHARVEYCLCADFESHAA
jgi:hypothetical protein